MSSTITDVPVVPAKPCSDQTIRATPRGKSKVDGNVVRIEDAAGKPINAAQTTVGRKVSLRAGVALIKGQIKTIRWEIKGPNVGNFEVGAEGAIVTPTVTDQEALVFYFIEGNRSFEVCLHVQCVVGGVEAEYEAAVTFEVAAPKLKRAISLEMEDVIIADMGMRMWSTVNFELEPAGGEVAMVIVAMDWFEKIVVSPEQVHKPHPSMPTFDEGGLPPAFYVEDKIGLRNFVLSIKSPESIPISTGLEFMGSDTPFCSAYWHGELVYFLMWRENADDIWTTLTTRSGHWTSHAWGSRRTPWALEYSRTTLGKGSTRALPRAKVLRPEGGVCNG